LVAAAMAAAKAARGTTSNKTLQVRPPQQTKQQGMYVEDDSELC